MIDLIDQPAYPRNPPMTTSLKNLAYTFAAAGMMVLGGYSSANAQKGKKNNEPRVDSTFSLNSRIDPVAFEKNQEYRKGVENFYAEVAYNPQLQKEFLGFGAAEEAFAGDNFFGRIFSKIEMKPRIKDGELTNNLEVEVGARQLSENSTRFTISTLKRDRNGDGILTNDGPSSVATRYDLEGKNSTGGNTYVRLEYNADEILVRYKETNVEGVVHLEGDSVLRKKGNALFFVSRDGTEMSVPDGHIAAQEKFDDVIKRIKKGMQENHDILENNGKLPFSWGKRIAKEMAVKSTSPEVENAIYRKVMPSFEDAHLSFSNVKEGPAAKPFVNYHDMKKARFSYEAMQKISESASAYGLPAGSGKYNVTMKSDSAHQQVNLVFSLSDTTTVPRGSSEIYTVRSSTWTFADVKNTGIQKDNAVESHYIKVDRSSPEYGRSQYVAQVIYDEKARTVEFTYNDNGIVTRQKFAEQGGTIFLKESTGPETVLPTNITPVNIGEKFSGTLDTIKKIKESFTAPVFNNQLPKPLKRQ